MEICLDTDVIIEILRNKDRTISWLSEHLSDVFYITQITIFELYKGAYRRKNTKELALLQQFLSQISVLPLTNDISLTAGIESAKLELQGFTVDYRDMLIGICAREHGVFLKTYNSKDFVRISEFKLL